MKTLSRKQTLFGVSILALLLLTVGAWFFVRGIGFKADLIGSGDVYLPAVQFAPNEQGTIALKAGKNFSQIAGIQFSISFKDAEVSVYDGNTNGLKTSSFLLIKNTKTEGLFQVSMANATGIDIATGDTLLNLLIQMPKNINQNREIALNLTNISLVDITGKTIPVTAGNGKITVSGITTTDGQPFIQSISPNFSLSSKEVQVTIRGKNYSTTNIKKVTIGASELTNISGVNGMIKGTLPAGLPTGVYDVTVFTPDGKTIKKEQSFTVIESSEGLTIDETASFFAPSKVKNDGVMKTTLWVNVCDGRGVEDIEYVDVNLEAFDGIPSNRMKSDKIVDTCQWFYLPDITVPKSISTSADPYKVTITATNRLGKVAKGSVSLHVSNDLEKNMTPVVHRSFTVPPEVSIDGDSTFSIYSYVTLEDGPDFLQSVAIDLSEIGEGTKAMEKVGDAIGNGYWYRVDDLKINKKIDFNDTDSNTSRGDETRRKAIIMASSKSGDVGTGDAIITIDPNLNPPRVDSQRSYATPTAIANDGAKDVTLYAFVFDRDGHEDIASVSIDLRAIGLEPVNHMEVLNTEGPRGKWYKFTTKIPLMTAPSSDPYELPITATDNIGSIGTGKIFLRVIPENPTQVAAPKVDAAVPTSDTTIEIIFNKSLNPGTVPAAGATFIITNREDISKKLQIKSAALNAAGNIVTLTTARQEENKPYTIRVDPRVTDTEGVSIKQGYFDTANFRGFVGTTKSPTIKLIASTAIDTIEIVFWEPIKPSSVSPDGADFRVYQTLNSSYELEVERVSFKDPSTLILLTEPQKYGVDYGMRITNLQSSSGVPLPDVGLESFFKGHVSSLVGDLNFDRKVDFHDFTIFSDAYRKARGFEKESDTQNINTNANNVNTNSQVNINRNTNS